MPELLTTDEAALYLRLSERKLYELVANGAVPCSKVTGRWLFPKAALDRWIASGLAQPQIARETPPPIVGGSHDPLLESALRDSGSGLASLAEGSEAGLRRLARGEIAIAAIHLHQLDDNVADANIEVVRATSGLHDTVLIAFARRQQGLLVAAGNPLGLSDLPSAAAKKARVAQRPGGAGAQLLLLSLLAAAGLTPDDLELVRDICQTGNDVAQAVRSGRVDCGVATRSAAAGAGVDFVPLVWENFDLVLRQRDYFQSQPQQLFAFMRSDAFAAKAADLGGYDVAEAGRVRLVN
ncbi:MAG: helix-turn-helix transcriptional regulator [Pseudorhodoplanes sp.]|jgi:excisionase family DNA binding protein|nr:helix-turn-helix transcriptional regulator [Pseudorhodoplanes sp.]